ncbi:tetratricopeptide repeat protein [Streptomyces sp. NPDC007907]|uniref:tetratricopeptide repeat protein n=1 Tax=Streptomyces sp. NPDC007907 TaxID=3364789 RepID=UPI0036E10B64
MNNLGSMLRERFGISGTVTDLEEAIEIMQEALDSSSADDPRRPALLNNLGTMLADVGRREEALEAASQAVAIRQRLAATNPDAYEADLAMSLNNLGTMLADVGRREEALEAASQAVAIRQRLAATNPDAYEADLAMSLNNLGTMLADVGRREEALEAASQAVAIRQRLAATNPDAYEADLAMSLNNLGTMLADVGRREEALEAASQAVAIRQRLAATNPDAYEADLAMSLNNLGTMLADVGRREEALEAASQAVAIRQRLAATNPDAYEADLAMSLNNLGNRLLAAGRHNEALSVIQEALSVYRRLETRNLAGHESDFVASLSNHAGAFMALGDTEKAIDLYRQALDYSMQVLGEDHPHTFSIRGNLAEAYESAGDSDRAIPLYEKTLAASMRVLGERHPRTLSIRSSLTGAAIRRRLTDTYGPAIDATNDKRGESAERVGDARNSIKFVAPESRNRMTIDQEFSDFYRQSIQGLVGFLMWQGASLEVAADISQDTMASLYRSWATIEHPRTWVRRTASRALVRHIASIEEIPAGRAPNMNPLPGRSNTPEWEEGYKVLELLSQLPPRQRQILAWTLDGYTPDEISAELGVSVASLRSNLLKARRHLAALLQEK